MPKEYLHKQVHHYTNLRLYPKQRLRTKEIPQNQDTGGH